MKLLTDMLSTIALVVLPFCIVVLTWIMIAMELLQFHFN